MLLPRLTLQGQLGWMVPCILVCMKNNSVLMNADYDLSVTKGIHLDCPLFTVFVSPTALFS